MKALFALLMTVAWCAQANEIPPAFRKHCAQLPESSLRFSVARVEPVVDQNLSLNELRTFVSAASGAVVLSVTELKGMVDIEMTRRSASDPASGLHCARYSAVITLGGAPQEVHIARELPPHSCVYRAVLQREMENVRINEVRLHAAAQALTAQAVGEFGPKAWYGSLDEIADQVRTELTILWLARVDHLLQPAADARAMQATGFGHSIDLSDCTDLKPAVTASVAY